MKLFYLTLVLVFSQAAHAQLYQTSIGLKGGFPGYGSLNAGYIMSIIGTVLGGLGVLYYIVIGGTMLAILGNM